MLAAWTCTSNDGHPSVPSYAHSCNRYSTSAAAATTGNALPHTTTTTTTSGSAARMVNTVSSPWLATSTVILPSMLLGRPLHSASDNYGVGANDGVRVTIMTIYLAPNLAQMLVNAYVDHAMNSVYARLRKSDPFVLVGQFNVDIRKDDCSEVSFIDYSPFASQVKWWVYLAYIKAMGKWLTALTFVSYVFSHAFNIMGSYWLSLWSNDALDPVLATDPQQRNFRLGMYAMYGIVETMFILVGSISLNLAALRGSKILHAGMLDRVLCSPMSFFDTTPMGRILNRLILMPIAQQLMSGGHSHNSTNYRAANKSASRKRATPFNSSKRTRDQNGTERGVSAASELRTGERAYAWPPPRTAPSWFGARAAEIDGTDREYLEAASWACWTAHCWTSSELLRDLSHLSGVESGGVVLHSQSMCVSVAVCPHDEYVSLGFSKDIDTADVTLRFNLRMLMMQFFRTVVSFILISMENPIFLAAVIPLLIIYYFVQKFYIATSRQLKRLESISRSPIYVHFSETVSGSSSIRAYGAGERFVARSNELTDINHSSFFPSIAASRWLSIRLEFLGYSIVFIAALLAVLTRETLSPGLAGLSVSYALTVTSTLNMLVRATSDTETNLVAVERCFEYTRTPQEYERSDDA
ncbi:hypothetical protein HPB51_012619 [Rhipicephalus microplus]|uniref:ABC transmembrane type-1 domain-containing protein n=1 Tax=Rhipicephalus microplus TaxID=6941 RepID=A0A9J6E1K2_RHIMP|nr:hypothetical protein HPB51_012619 [Rhipicephalus microplus]